MSSIVAEGTGWILGRYSGPGGEQRLQLTLSKDFLQLTGAQAFALAEALQLGGEHVNWSNDTSPKRLGGRSGSLDATVCPCTVMRPCCDHRNESNEYNPVGSVNFVCPKGCACHD